MPTIAGGPFAGAVTGETAVLEALVNPNGQEVTGWRFALGSSDCSVKPTPCKFTTKLKIPAGSSPVAVEREIGGLEAGSVYHFLLEAENGEGKAASADRVFATAGEPASGLPDERAYEQASPIDKDGGDAAGAQGLSRAAADGDGVIFGSAFGMPGGKGAQALPFYLAMRSEGPAASWSSQGLLPPPLFGEGKGQVQGELADFSESFSKVAKPGNPATQALIAQSTTGGPATIVSPYAAGAALSYVGADADASTVFFEASAQLKSKEEGGTPITAAAQGHSNVYAWDRATGEVHLAGELNDQKAPPRGTFAGPYNFSRGINANTLRTGGSTLGYYIQGTHAISAQGDVYFTEAGTGQLYLRLNPTKPQSPMSGEECLEPETKACTIHVSASKRSTPDPGGPQPAAFQVAAEDGSAAFFTSPEKLTEESNTGPEQPEAAIGEGSRESGTVEEPELVPKRHAIGVAVAGSHLYWADPTTGGIGRSGLDGSGAEDIIAPGTGECELNVETTKNHFEVQKVEVPSSPRYVAVDAAEKYVYWTNSGRLNKNGVPLDGQGTIGRAELDSSGNPVAVEPAFICGEVEPSPGVREAAVSNPQGIAVNGEHLYWVNDAEQDYLKRSIARANLDGSGVEGGFLKFDGGNRSPYGVALDAGHLYFATEEQGSSNNGYVQRTTLAGAEPSNLYIGKDTKPRGVAVEGGHVYWAAQGTEAIGRMPLADYPSPGNCSEIPTCEPEFMKFTKPIGSLNGLAADAQHLYWSINGEAPGNPGNDLYRFEPAGEALEDITYVPGEENGAEVQGVLGASGDGSRVYFAANADLDGAGPAEKGSCKTSTPHGLISQTTGNCEIYLWEEGAISAVARVQGADAIDWTGTPRELFTGFAPKGASVSADGATLLFLSREKLTPYANEGVPELYRFHQGEGIDCVSCSPRGEAPGAGPTLSSVEFPGPTVPQRAFAAMVQSRNLSAEGKRVFFETAEALVPADTDGQGGCPGVGPYQIPSCQDVYEWEAPGEGSCTQGGPGYSPLTGGCTFLISSGKDPYPSYFADASQSGEDAFIFTRQSLVGQDKDELQDVYDAKVRGGIAAQSPVAAIPCESTEACHGPYPAPSGEASAGSASFAGPGNPKPKHKKAKPKHRKHKRKHHHRKKQGKQRAKSGRRAGR